MGLKTIIFLSILTTCCFSKNNFQEVHEFLLYFQQSDEPDFVSQPLEFTKTDLITFGIASVLIMIAAGGGIGGGGVLVPTYIFVLRFAPKFAIPLSNATIFGSSLANLIFNLRKRHPNADRPCIDWNIMLVMEPLTVAGALVGSFINVLTPPWLLCCLLVLLLSGTAIKTYMKGIKMFKKESEKMKGEEVIGSGSKAVLIPVDNIGPDMRLIEAKDAGNMEYAEILDLERHTHFWKVALMFVVTGGMLAITIMKGGSKLNPLNIVCGTTAYWAITLSALPLVFVISAISRCHLVNMFHRKKECQYEYMEGDVEWNEWHTIKYPLICSIAGLCAGMFGIGGGIVKGPLMLEMGVLPEVTSATSATMILFTSSAATASYLLFNSLNYHYGFAVFCLGFVNTLVGQKVLNVMVKRYGRSSLIVLLIATIVGLSAVAMGLESGGSLIDLLNGKATPPQSLCG